MSDLIKLQTNVPDLVRKRVWMYADREGVTVSQWLARLIRVATMPGADGKTVRAKVAERLAK